MYDASKIVSVPWTPRQDGKGGVKGKFSNHNKIFLKKLSCFAKSRGGGMPCVNFLFASNTLYFPPILLLSINTSDFTSASRGEDKHVHVELETKDRNVYMLLLLASFLLCFPNWANL